MTMIIMCMTMIIMSMTMTMIIVGMTMIDNIIFYIDMTTRVVRESIWSMWQCLVWVWT